MKCFHLLLSFTLLHLSTLIFAPEPGTTTEGTHSHGGSPPASLVPSIEAGEQELLEKYLERHVFNWISDTLRIVSAGEPPPEGNTIAWRRLCDTQEDMAKEFDEKAEELQKKISSQQHWGMHYLQYHTGYGKIVSAAGINRGGQLHVRQAFIGAAFEKASVICLESAEKDFTEARGVQPLQKAGYIAAATAKINMANSFHRQALGAWQRLPEEFRNVESEASALLTHDVNMLLKKYFPPRPN